LKKRSKKLLQIGAALVRLARLQTNKSFLVLFFKKEHSSASVRKRPPRQLARAASRTSVAGPK